MTNDMTNESIRVVEGVVVLDPESPGSSTQSRFQSHTFRRPISTATASFSLPRVLGGILLPILIVAGVAALGGVLAIIAFATAAFLLLRKITRTVLN